MACLLLPSPGSPFPYSPFASPHGYIRQAHQPSTTLDELNTVVIVSHDLAPTTTLSDTLWLLGPERDAAGQCLPGATITKKHQYNLAEMGLTWQPGIQARPEFVQLIEHLKEEIRKT